MFTKLRPRYLLQNKLWVGRTRGIGVFRLRRRSWKIPLRCRQFPIFNTIKTLFARYNDYYLKRCIKVQGKNEVVLKRESSILREQNNNIIYESPDRTKQKSPKVWLQPSKWCRPWLSRRKYCTISEAFWGEIINRCDHILPAQPAEHIFRPPKTLKLMVISDERSIFVYIYVICIYVINEHDQQLVVNFQPARNLSIAASVMALCGGHHKIGFWRPLSHNSTDKNRRWASEKHSEELFCQNLLANFLLVT